MLKASNLSLRYGPQIVLDGIDISLAAGATLGITGPSGSGKSSLLSILGCMSKPHGGSYHFQGRDVLALSAAEQARFRGEQLGFVFQSSCLLGHMSLLENLLVAVEHLPGPLKPWHSRAHELLSQMGIADLAQRKPHQVSGGQAQRAAIARALMRDPALILADEPTGSLDHENAMAVLALLQALARQDKAVVVVTHSPEIAAAMSQTLALQSGKAMPAC